MAGRPYRDVHSDLTRLVSTHPFTLGRLVWLASLKDPENGRYQYSGWVDRLGTDDIDRMLRTSHQQAFAGWLSCTLEHQTSDFVEYLSSLDGTQRTGFCALEWLKSLPPESARAADRELFVCDLRLVIGLAEG